MASSSPGNARILAAIEQLYNDNKSADDVLATLSIIPKHLKTMMNQDNISDNFSSILVHIIAKASTSTFRTNRPAVLNLLQSVSESSLLNTRGTRLLVGITCTNKDFHSYPCLLSDFVTILNELSYSMPTLCTTPQVVGLVDFLREQISECDQLENKTYFLDSIFQIKNNIMASWGEQSKSKRINPKRDPEDDMQPPEDFRTLSVIPVETDIFEKPNFLRRNKVNGKYKDLQHYLDVQFRLYREDCIQPLRETLLEYLEKEQTNRRGRLESGLIYRDVMVVGQKTSLESGEVFAIKLDEKHCSLINWQKSKRLIYGSLLLLSFDKFKTVFFAVVADSDRETLQKNGCFTAQIFQSGNHHKLPRNTYGILLEATAAYFEAYKHVLNALQKITEDTFPFQKYLVYCEENVDMPIYISMESKYDLRPVIENCRIDLGNTRIRQRVRYGLPEPVYKIQLLNQDDWLSLKELNMDESQRQAFKSALTKEFVLIQGPPGTGKTYLGLQIAKTLLHNSSRWNHNENCKPYMLVVCFTNHALDQFVEGIVAFMPQLSNRRQYPDVIRFGGQSKNENLAQFSIQKVRRNVRNYSDNPRNAVLENASKIKVEIKEIQDLLKAIQNSNIVMNLDTLKEIIPEQHWNIFGNARNCVWFDWLHVNVTSWFKEVHKHYQDQVQNKPNANDLPSATEEQKEFNANNPSPANEQEESVKVVTEADYAYNERYIEVDDIKSDLNLENLGINLDKQLDTIFEQELEDRCKHILTSEKRKAVTELLQEDCMSTDKATSVTNVWKLTLQDRWKLYRYWRKEYVKLQHAKLQQKGEQYNEIFKEYIRASRELDEEIMRNATVVAMTTTCAARYNESLNKVGAKVIIVEEAAEVPEAHIVTAINPKCQHLILIGDHMQLEPKPAVHELGKQFNLSVSLFERMLKNGLDYHCLKRQHRMRPEISLLVRHIYDVLEDNENVLEYNPIRGLRSSLFFVTHDHKEKFNDDGRSFSNDYEAEYLKELCLYLIKQGYKATEITIIAAYTGQMFCLRQKMPRREFDGVNICVLDNYQGEENEIILLSLVRSNDNGDIGFLSRLNRICVALSRAKQGLYIIGNSATLTKNSTHWLTVMEKFKGFNEKSSIMNDTTFGKALPLYCQNHPHNEGILAESPADFAKAPDGGCELPCEFRLDCGHACRYKCHPVDKEHKMYQCRAICLQRCKDNHVCRRKCHHPNNCECKVMMTRELPCSHTETLACHIDYLMYDCKVLMKRELPCSHTPFLPCHLNYLKYNCKVTVTRTLECGHEGEMKCFRNPKDFVCEIIVNRSLVCGHFADIKCHVKPTSHKCMAIITGQRSKCGHEFQRQCFDVYYERLNECKDIITVKRTKCNHEYSRQCHDIRYELNPYHKCKEIVTVKRTTCKHEYQRECSDNFFEIKNKCMEKIKEKWPLCTHMYERHCFDVDYNNRNKCQLMIDDVRSECGHEYKRHCSDTDYKTRVFCTTVVTKTFPECGHHIDLPCHTDILSKQCKENIQTEFKCGHSLMHACFLRNEVTCNSTCNQFCKNLHICLKKCHYPASCNCQELVEVILEKCQHQQKIPCSTNPNEFDCSEVVKKTIPKCGHVHDMKCHINAETFKCTTSVTKILPDCGHKKLVACYSDVLGVKCTKEVDVVLDRCGHKTQVQCWQKDSPIDDVKCRSEIAYIRPSCRHRLNIECWKKDYGERALSTCNNDIEIKLKCGHILKCLCSSTTKDRVCIQKCNKRLSCGHSCPNLCHACEFSNSHGECQAKCDKELICGHMCQSNICMKCKPCSRPCNFSCPHAKCGLKCLDFCAPCKRECSWQCPHFKCTKLCSEKCNRPRCKEDCDKILKCGHPCQGYCSEPCPESCIRCKPKMFKNGKNQRTVTLPACGHSFDHEILDEVVEHTKDEFSHLRCPSCKTIIHHHPRYNDIIIQKKTFLEYAKDQIRNRKHNPAMVFPTFTIGYKYAAERYTRSFATFLNILQHIPYDTDFSDVIQVSHDFAASTLDEIRRKPIDDFKQWLLISHRIFKVYVFWIVCIFCTKPDILQKHYHINELLTNEIKNDIDLVNNLEMAEGEDVNRPTGKRILTLIYGNISSEKKEYLQQMLQPMIDDIDGNAYLDNACMWPQTGTVIGIHNNDWTLCKNGHVTSTVIGISCHVCNKGYSQEIELTHETDPIPDTESAKSFQREERGRGRGRKRGRKTGGKQIFSDTIRNRDTENTPQSSSSNMTVYDITFAVENNKQNGGSRTEMRARGRGRGHNHKGNMVMERSQNENQIRRESQRSNQIYKGYQDKLTVKTKQSPSKQYNVVSERSRENKFTSEALTTKLDNKSNKKGQEKITSNSESDDKGAFQHKSTSADFNREQSGNRGRGGRRGRGVNRGRGRGGRK